jgi:hypothetical protein
VGQIAKHTGRERLSEGASAQEMEVDLDGINATEFSVRMGTMSGLDNAENDIWV